MASTNVGWAPETLNWSILEAFNNLDQNGQVQVEYIWIGGNGGDIRCKTKTLQGKISSVEQLPEWNYDGSSTNQAPGEDSEVLLRPRAIFRDPFRRGDNILVMCDTWDSKGNPIPTNTRAPAVAIFEQAPEEEPWFGIEQEYTLFSADGYPLGWPKGGYPGPQGPYYCSVGSNNAFGRALVEAHYKACLYAGIKMSGINAEVTPGQWEFQVGPCTGIEAGDQVWIARYIMQRLSEMFNVIVSFDPKPISGNWNGAGAHTNYSTKKMREKGGMEVIKTAISKLGEKHAEHIKVYGEGNERRLTGHHETADINTFSWGIGHRGSSIRVGADTAKKGYGYLEDRRPASNCDPYVVTSRIFETTVLYKRV